MIGLKIRVVITSLLGFCFMDRGLTCTLTGMIYGVIFLSMTTLFLQGLAQLLGPWSVRRVVLSVLLFSAALIQYHFYLLHTRLLLDKTAFFLSYIPLLMAFGPLMRLYFLVLSKQAIFSVFAVIKHSLMPVFGVAYYVFYALYPRVEIRQILDGLYAGSGHAQFYLISFLSGLTLLVYAVIILKEQPKFWHRDALLNVPLLMGWALINICFVIAMMFCVFSGAFLVFITHVGNVIVSLVFIGIFLVNLRYPELFVSWLFEVQKNQRTRQYLGEIDPVDMLETIRNAMMDDELFKDTELSLEKLSDLFDLTRYQLSELLNDYAGVSFHDFVAKYRVEAAKKTLLDDPWKKVISVATEVGFNSQATFNKTFKKWTGMTPSEFQKNSK